MKAVRTRCPQKPLQYLAVPIWSSTLCLRFPHASARYSGEHYPGKLPFPNGSTVGKQDAFLAVFSERKIIDGQEMGWDHHFFCQGRSYPMDMHIV